MRVGVLKPDHLGDLILAAPAIAALWRRFHDLTLRLSPRSSAGSASSFSFAIQRTWRLPDTSSRTYVPSRFICLIWIRTAPRHRLPRSHGAPCGTRLIY